MEKLDESYQEDSSTVEFYMTDHFYSHLSVYSKNLRNKN